MLESSCSLLPEVTARRFCHTGAFWCLSHNWVRESGGKVRESSFKVWESRPLVWESGPRVWESSPWVQESGALVGRFPPVGLGIRPFPPRGSGNPAFPPPTRVQESGLFLEGFSQSQDPHHTLIL